MDSNAPGPFLGFSIQIPRALFHLLRAGPGDIVCVEVLGDVATITDDNHVISEEDKSSTTSNPLTNKSTDLWKTFYNWITAHSTGEIDIKKTYFIIFTNKMGRPGIVNAFHTAKTKEEAQNAVAEAKEQLSDIDKNHDIWKYFDYVMQKNEKLLVEIIQKFELHVGYGAGYNEVKDELVKKHLPATHITFLLENIVGWLHKELTVKIASRQPARIKWEDFDKHVKVYFNRTRWMELIDFTMQEPLQKNEIEEQVKIRSCYVRQLEAIDYEVADIVEAVTDYLRAKVNRDKWIENGNIDETIASDFERRLIAFWRNSYKAITITGKDLSEQERGRLLVVDCENRQEPLGIDPPPRSTIAGTYHALADEPILGWHPNWENLFQKRKDG